MDEINGYHCDCLPGYIRVTELACVEIDECLVGAHLCDEDATCVNSAGGYDCVCNTGYGGSGFVCSDVDECSEGTHMCDEHAVCTNTIGSHTCTCEEGYLGEGRVDGVGCQDYCYDSPCLYGSNCTFDRNGYTCECLDGYEGEHCDLNATVCSALDPCVAGADCINGPVVGPDAFPQFTCNCSAGLGDPSCAVLKPSASTQDVFTGDEAPYVFAAIAAGAVLAVLAVALVVRRSSSRSSGPRSARHTSPTAAKGSAHTSAPNSSGSGSGSDAEQEIGTEETAFGNDAADGSEAASVLPDETDNDVSWMPDPETVTPVAAPVQSVTDYGGQQGDDDEQQQQQQQQGGDGEGEELKSADASSAKALAAEESPYADLNTALERRTSALVRGSDGTTGSSGGDGDQGEGTGDAHAVDDGADEGKGSKLDTVDKIAMQAESLNSPVVDAVPSSDANGASGNDDAASTPYYSVHNSNADTAATMYEVLPHSDEHSAVQANSLSAFESTSSQGQ